MTALTPPRHTEVDALRLPGRPTARRFAWPALALLVIAGLPVPLYAGGGGGRITAYGRSAGAVLSLSLPAHAFPRGSLVVAHAQLRNASPRTFAILSEPQVTVVSRVGRPVYSGSQDGYPDAFPQLRTSRPTGGGTASFPLLAAGHVHTYRVFIVLRGNEVSAHARVAAHVSPARTDPMPAVSTARLRPRLYPAPPPPAMLRQGGDGLVVVVRPRPRTAQGSPWFVDVARCGTSFTGTLNWTRAEVRYRGAYRIPAPCYGHPSEWHVAVGWLGQPLAYISYRRS